MKATIDFDDALYRRLKVEAARRGRTIKDLVDEGVRRVLNTRVAEDIPGHESVEWFGALRAYAVNAGGKHDMESARASVAKRRPRA